MRLLDCTFLADENFDPESTSYLREKGWDIVSAVEAGLAGRSDVEVLRAATGAGRVVLTHDRDFGMIAIVSKEPLEGLVFIRPGHIAAAMTNRTLDVLMASNPEVHRPFILVARQKDGVVAVRIRRV